MPNTKHKPDCLGLWGENGIVISPCTCGADKPTPPALAGAKLYGRCPICHELGVSAERSPYGVTTCAKGHTYPHRDRVYPPDPPAPTEAENASLEELRQQQQKLIDGYEQREKGLLRENAAQAEQIKRLRENLDELAPEPSFRASGVPALKEASK